MFRIHSFRAISSTQDKAKEFSKKGISDIVIVADRQTKGHGRFQRKWISSKGGLYCTIVLPIDDLNATKFLTFIVSIAVANTSRKVARLPAKIKWPNDVLIDGKKVCGILTETSLGEKSYAFIGIGLNVNQKRFPKNLRMQPTSLFLETEKEFDINEILASILKEFDTLFQAYKKNKHSKIIGLWKKHSHTLGKKVKVKTREKIIAGKAVSIDADCNLVVKTKNGKKEIITEGDVFVL